jgi:glycerate kinase
VIGSGGSAYCDGGLYAMTQGLGVFKAIGKDGSEINMADMKLKDVR